MPVKLEQVQQVKLISPESNCLIYSRVPLPKRRRTALDIGAFVGEWSNLLAGDFNAVVAFEVRENNRAMLRKNASPNVIVPNIGLGRQPEMAEFVLRGAGPGGGRYAQHIALGRSGPREVLPVMNLDAFGFDSVDLIKMDVDGSERDVIYGGVETFWRCKPWLVIETKLLNPWGRQDLLRLIDYEVHSKVSAIDEVWVARENAIVKARHG